MKPGLICFDLDGTLYYDRLVYPRIISHFFEDTPYRGWINVLQSEVEAILRGERKLHCGHFVPKSAAVAPREPADLLCVASEAILLSGASCPERGTHTYLGDGWTLAMYLARRIGWEGDAFWTRFRRAREDLISPVLGPRPNAELRQCLQELRRAGVVAVLCSNAREEYGRSLLRHLELEDCFDACIFDADKPHSFPAWVAEWGRRYALTPGDMLFVGDQGYYDLYAGKQMGGRTLLVSPNEVADAALWDGRIAMPEELLRTLAAFL